MSDLETEILVILRGHEEGLSAECVYTKIAKPNRSKCLPRWVVSFALNSLRVKGYTAKVGSLWIIRSGGVESAS